MKTNSKHLSSPVFYFKVMKKLSPKVIIFITVFIDLIGFGIIIPLSPYLARNFGADAFQVGLLMSIYSLMQFLFAPFWGQMSDNHGRRPIILLSLLGAAASHLLFAFGSSLWVLFVARGLAGMFGANISTAMAYIADVTDEKDRSKGMGMIGAAFGLGFMLGPFLGGISGDLGMMLGSLPPFGESFPAVVAAAICFVNFLAAIRFLPESRKVAQGYVYRQKKPRLQLFFKHIKKPVVGQLILIFFLSSFGMAHMEASLFLYVQDVFSWSLIKASMGFAYVGLVMVITQGYLIRKFLPKYGERRLMLIGLLLGGLGLSGIAYADEVWKLALFTTFLGLGVGLSNPSITGSISLLSGKDEQGGVMGVNQSLSAVARIIGPALGGWFYRDISMGSPFLVAGGLLLLGMIIGFLVYDKIPQKGLQKNV